MCRASPPTDQQQQAKGGGKNWIKDGKDCRNEKKQDTHRISESSDPQSSDEEVFSMHNLNDSKMAKVDPITTLLDVNGNLVKFEVDTGCSVTILSRAEYG